MPRGEDGTGRNGWDPAIRDQLVRLRDNPGRRGLTTGRTKKAGSYLLVEVDFGPNEKSYKRYDLLELVESEEDMFELLAKGRFGGPIDLRRVLTFEKVKGDLTDVFYSMEASNTDFYPHQFKPVLKFIESPVGRLLIADEVGLGKTIEALYIWKELQARQQARRLLVICPAMLREKWRGDLKRRFNISGDIVSPKHALDKVSEVSRSNGGDAFVCISSLEGLRPPANYEDPDKNSTPARFARMLDQHTATDEFALFDLVILDEAHYLRNPSTASNRLGRLLRDASRHMLLLTATPIQIASDNLYQLLRIVDPDEFYDSTLFEDMLRANGPVVAALRSLWRSPPDIDTATSALQEALTNTYFADDAVLARVSREVSERASDPERRVELARLLETRSLLGQYMTRSRKREVLEHRVERGAQVLQVRFSDLERAIYDRVTDRIRTQSVGKTGVSLFALMARQRQMASSLVAALESWQEKGILEELVWEDLGRSYGLDQLQEDKTETTEPPIEDILRAAGIKRKAALFGGGYDFRALEAADGKYRKLRDFLRKELDRNPSEKFVVFAFYRRTLEYLARRLKKDGIRPAVIMGSMGNAKDHILEEFGRPDGPSVLLSSEVGSEGIDLQFCRILVNYDLPWNPMRVEQRIGRLDRLGQKAERISIVNIAVFDTIEDRILLRLYERIQLFQESIGDLEEILGAVTEQLMIELLNPELSDPERQRRAEQAQVAIINRRAEQNRLEQEAVNLIGFSDFILAHISDSREKGRWLSGDELLSFVDDFFAQRYPGTKIEKPEAGTLKARIRLSEEARQDLALFIAESKPATRTRLNLAAPVLCIFDPRQSITFSRDLELIEPTHPLIQWIRSVYANAGRSLHPVPALRLGASQAEVAPGDYVFVVHRWSLAGLRSENFLEYRALALESGELLNGSASESLVMAAARRGGTFANAANVVGDLMAVKEGARKCDKALEEAFDIRTRDFEAENELHCSQQETSARKFAERRMGELNERLARFRAEGREKLIPMTEGLLQKEKDQLNAKLAVIARRREIKPEVRPLAAGLIRVGRE